MALRIACDLDGTLADMDAALQREATRLFGGDVDLHAVPGPPLDSAEDVEGQLRTGAAGNGADGSMTSASGRRPLTRVELRRLWAHVGDVENFWNTLDEIEPGAVAQLSRAAEEHRWEVIFLTQRPGSAGDTAQRQSQRWLQAHGFAFPSVFVMSGSRGKVAEALALDAVIDDRVENCLDVSTDSSAKPLLVWRRQRDLVPPGLSRTSIEPVSSIAEAIQRLESMMAERARRQSFVGRVRQAIGL